MADKLIGEGLQYGTYLLEGVLFFYMLLKGQWRLHLEAWLYLLVLVVIDGGARPYVLQRYGFESHQYGYFYWATNILLAVAAFALVCAFFRRACVTRWETWHFLRVLLAFVLVIVAVLSYLSLPHDFESLRQKFVIEFQENLFFACLVLNTLLYIMLQYVDHSDDRLGLLACGLGIQFAGPAASLALVHVTFGNPVAYLLYTHVEPLCTLGMLLVWFYAESRVSSSQAPPGRNRTRRKRVAALAEARIAGMQ